jgi:serine phosphatase RsbU (regulator of sigma subunit)
MVSLKEVGGPREFRLRGKVTLIGRDPHCDIVVAARETSGRHAMLLNAEGEWYVEDLDSANGTRVNGRSARVRIRLRHGDRLEIPGLTAEFRDESAVLSPLPVTAPAPPPGPLPPGHRHDAGSAILRSLDARSEVRIDVAPEAKLRAFVEISRNLAATLELRELLPRILDSLFAIFPQADDGVVLLRDGDATGPLIPRAVRHREGFNGTAPPVSRTVLDYVMNAGQAVLSVDVAGDDRFGASESLAGLRLRSVMCAPMLGQNGSGLGAVMIDTRDPRRPFRQEDLDLLAGATVLAARAVELAALHEELRDLEAASQIQKSFLPTERPPMPRVRFFDHYASARHVGGDYYDYIPLSGGRLAVAVGDVAGKGVSAALLMARLSATTRFCLASEPTAGAAVRRLNGLLARTPVGDRFVTFVVAVIDPSAGTVTVVNAGHPPPILRRRGSASAPGPVGAEAASIPLGCLDLPYEEAVVPLEPGDAWTLYTDGITETRNPAGDLYGMERLASAAKSAPADVESFGEALLADVRRFAAGRPAGDDLTMVCFGVDPSE